MTWQLLSKKIENLPLQRQPWRAIHGEHSLELSRAMYRDVVSMQATDWRIFLL